MTTVVPAPPCPPAPICGPAVEACFDEKLQAAPATHQTSTTAARKEPIGACMRRGARPHLRTIYSPPQQLHPQIPAAHDSGTHAPLLQVSPQGQTGLQIFPEHFPFVHVPPPAQPHLPTQPSLAPQVPSVGQTGLQQLPP